VIFRDLLKVVRAVAEYTFVIKYRSVR